MMARSRPRGNAGAAPQRRGQRALPAGPVRTAPDPLEEAMTTTAPQGPAVVAPLDAATRLDLYRTMVLARTFEEAILREYHADKGPGFDIGKGLVPGEMHLAAGQEPVAAGVCAHLTSDDAVTATHRPHHLAIAHGVDLDRMAAEIFGRETGLGRGRGGHMHLFDPAVHFSCSGIIAEGYPAALGQAFAFRARAPTGSPSPSPVRAPPTRAPSTSR